MGVLYERHPYQMLLDLEESDLVFLHAAGAYTSTYALVGFNGSPPLEVVALSPE